MSGSVKEPSGLTEVRARVRAAYDPQLFQDAGERLIALLGEHLRRIEASQECVLNWRDPVANIAAAGAGAGGVGPAVVARRRAGGLQRAGAPDAGLRA